MIAAVTVVLALATGGVSLRAARLWWEASHVEDQGEPLASMEDAPELWILTAQVELNEIKAGAGKNRLAAKWTAWAAGMGAVTTVWAALAPLLDKII